MTEVTPWPQFTDFAKFQGSAWLSDVRNRANEFQKHAYILNYFLPGREFHEYVRAGANIKSHITLEETRTYGAFDAGELLNLPQTQTGTFATSHWTTARAPLSWNEREIILQSDGAFSREDRAQTFHNVYFEKMANFMRSVANDIDDEFTAMPLDPTTMESATGNVPRSLPFLINEASSGTVTMNGVTRPAWDGTNAPVADGYLPGVTTIAGIDPTDYTTSGTKSRWACQQFWYNQLHNATSEGFRALEGDDLTYALDSALLDLKFQAAPKAESYSFQNGDCVIFATRQGVQAIRQSLVSTANDRWEAMQPSAVGRTTMYGGHEVVRVSGLESTPLYPRYTAAEDIADDFLADIYDSNGAGTTVGTGRVTEGGYLADGTTGSDAITGPRYYLVNTRWLSSFFHRDKFFAQTQPEALQQRPDTFFMLLENYRNLHPMRMRAHGIVAPLQSISGVEYTA